MFTLVPAKAEVVEMKRMGKHIFNGPMTKGIMIR